MTLKDFKQHIESFPNGTEFNYGISDPFSWRGSYDEVAFSIIEKPINKEEILKKINLAYTETFNGYKGGDYKYHDSTKINFEEDNRNYTDGEYAAQIISIIEGQDQYRSQEERLVKLAFTE